MSTRTRSFRINKSNNPLNPNKNICALAIAKYFDVDHQVRYLHYMDDLVRAIRKKYTVRKILKYKSTSIVPFLLVQHELKNSKRDVIANIVEVGGTSNMGHVMLLDNRGNIIVDTGKDNTYWMINKNFALVRSCYSIKNKA